MQTQSNSEDDPSPARAGWSGYEGETRHNSHFPRTMTRTNTLQPEMAMMPPDDGKRGPKGMKAMRRGYLNQGSQLSHISHSPISSICHEA